MDLKSDELTPSILEQFKVKPKSIKGITVPAKALLEVAKFGFPGAHIGEGKFGAVYHFTPKNDEGKQVVKFIVCNRTDEETIQSFKAEEKVSSLIRHPNCISWEHAGHGYEDRLFYGWLIYPFKPINGQKVADDLVLKTKEQREICTRYLLKQLIPVLRRIADLRLVHNDIKPDNIMAEYTSSKVNFFLTDFGNARTRDMLVHSQHGALVRDISALLQTAVYFMTHRWHDIFRANELKVPEWLSNMIDLVKSLPMGSQVPYARLFNMMGVSRVMSSVNTFSGEDLEFQLRLAIARLDEKRKFFNDALKEAVDTWFEVPSPQLLPVNDLLKQLGQTAISILTPNPVLKATLHCLDDDEEGLVPWIAFASPKDKMHFGASISLVQILRNTEILESAVAFCT
jgi:serine/threonine protein kinase